MPFPSLFVHIFTDVCSIFVLSISEFSVQGDVHLVDVLAAPLSKERKKEKDKFKHGIYNSYFYKKVIFHFTDLV